MTTVDQTGFFQEGPQLRDEWSEDRALRHLLHRALPSEVLEDVTPSLAEMGELAAGELLELHRAMDRPENEPRLIRFDPWGRRIDRIETAPEWDRIAAVAAEHGVVATGYEGRHPGHDRLHQFALAYLFAPSSALYGCPLAMTDGAAKTLLAHGDDELIDRAVSRLTSRDPQVMWTSGQWMTERTGGSDVGVSETVATKDRTNGHDVWKLSGTKWFTSAITADMALTLARPEGNPPGGRGLAMFYVEVHRPEGGMNGIRVLRLKDKLGTRQMPTAELALEGTEARLVGETQNGTRNIAPMLHVTRLWNAVTAAAGMRRSVALATDYARRRTAFGSDLIDQPLHQTTLAWLRVQHEAALQIALRGAQLLGRDESGLASESEQRTLRLLLPIAKLVTGKQAVAVASEALEAFGGAGYIEDTHLPVLLRDAQVLPIWEGTTNVLSLDALRAIQREDALRPYVEEVRRAAHATSHPQLATVGQRAIDATEHAAAWLAEAVESGMDVTEHGARRFAFTLGRSLQAALLAQQGQHDLDRLGDGSAAAVARRFTDEGLDVLQPVGEYRTADAALARGETLDPDDLAET
ncbi:MAG: acyl-CoA dehydrogenase family protein [Actinobacteria bacterium]|nr:acyl-CoA dehydrogenase family protein [Actinomycetota bacterium]